MDRDLRPYSTRGWHEGQVNAQKMLPWHVTPVSWCFHWTARVKAVCLKAYEAKQLDEQMSSNAHCFLYEAPKMCVPNVSLFFEVDANFHEIHRETSIKCGPQSINQYKQLWDENYKGHRGKTCLLCHSTKLNSSGNNREKYQNQF